MGFAGSAIAQNVTFSNISRSNSKWLLLSGATDPPSEIAITSRRNRDTRGDKSGDFLKGTARDFVNMEDKCGAKLWNKVMDLYLEKTHAQQKIKKFFSHCQKNGYKPMLYYTGHGEIGTGNWCFHDGTLGIQEIDDMLPGDCFYPTIISDACYSGHWANYCFNKKIGGFDCLSASLEFSSALDIPDEGGELTLFLTGKLSRPKKEPIYSGGDRTQYPITSGYNKCSYTDYLSGHLKNNKNILISQNLCNQKFSGIFAPTNLYNSRPAMSWGMKSSYDGFSDYVDEQWEMNKNIYSLACDEDLGFGCYFMDKYGDGQSIVTKTSNIKEKWDQGKKITSCTAKGSTYYIVMTKNVVGYHGKLQTYFTKNSWSDIETEISKHWENGKIITGICYNHGLKQYLVVMTESTAGQNYERFKSSESSEKSKWEKKEYHEEDRHPTIYFLDPNDNQLFVVYTSDKNRAGYVTRSRTLIY